MFSPPIKVLYIVHISSKYTGANISMLNMLCGLRTKGIIPIVLLPPLEDMSLKEELTKLGIESHIMQYYMPIYPNYRTIRNKISFFPKLARAKWFNYWAKNRIIRFSRKKKIELIHTNIGPMLVGFEAAKALRIPHVWHLREFQDLDFNLKTWYTKEQFKAKLYTPNNYPIAISEVVFRHFDLRLPACVIYNGIFKSFQSQFIKEKETYFLYVGQLSENKGTSALINSFGEFTKTYKSYKLLIAGTTNDIGYVKHLNDLTLSKGIKEKVEFLGHRDDVSMLMAKATALIVPSFNEAFGRVTAEAMFNGCFVIGKKAGGTKEIIDKIGVGLFYDSDDQLVEAMKDVVNKGIYQYFDRLKYAMEAATLNFSVEENTKSIYEYYKKFFSNRSIKISR
ncbi:MAG: glycosyltransferase [Pedobacter sp.]|nr:MAG: glycosyltransferase [Pedobacter sp.]